MDQPFLYRVTREYPVEMDAMWAAWTDAQALEAWYHPVGIACIPQSATCEPTVGGAWSIAVRVPEIDFNACFFGRFLEVEEATRLVHSMHFTDDLEAFAARDESTDAHRVEITFAATETGIEVSFAQFGVLPGGDVERTKAGMESYFDSLGDYLGC